MEKKVELNDFQIVYTIGQGSFGEIKLVKRTFHQKEKVFALKIIAKDLLVKHQPYIEKQLLLYFNHPGIQKIYYTFQNQTSLFFVLELVDGCNLRLLSKSKFIFIANKLRHQVIVMYISQIIEILSYIHKNGVIYRDLKPDNLLITKQGHLKMVDFGAALILNQKILPQNVRKRVQAIRARYQIQRSQSQQHETQSKQIMKQKTVNYKSGYDSNRRCTFIGTPLQYTLISYISPQLIERGQVFYSSDIWALGCLMYQLYYGKTPFDQKCQFLVYQKICKVQYIFPNVVQFQQEPVIPQQAVQLISLMLKKNPAERIGACKNQNLTNFDIVKSHRYFEGIDFQRIFQGEMPFRKQLKIIKFKKDEFVQFQQKENQLFRQLSWKKQIKQKIVFSGRVDKKMFLGNYKSRHLILYNTFKLAYFDPFCGKLKGTIDLNQKAKIQLIGQGKWSLQTPKKKYSFRQLEHPANTWIQKIGQVLKGYKR